MRQYLIAETLILPLAGKLQLSQNEIYAVIVMSVILFLAFVILAKVLPDQGVYVVYRHPGHLAPDNEERKHDHHLILAAYEKSVSTKLHESKGVLPTLGRPWFEFLMRAEDISKWVDEIERLHSTGDLKYYTEFGFDNKGLGIEDVRSLELLE